jgi:RES domain-containing protein
MIVYRLTKGKYKKDLTGKGAELYGGRWNSKGIAMLYTSESRALAFAELAIHLPVGIVPKDYFILSVKIATGALIRKIDISTLPAGWRSNPSADATQRIGDRFIADNKYLVMQVPSAIVPGDFNYLLNPRHRQMETVTIETVEPFEFDSRFAGRKP